MTENEIAWLAGILEGEGCFDYNNLGQSKRTGSWYPRIRIEMTDKDVVEKVANLLKGHGEIHFHAPRVGFNAKPTWSFMCSSRERMKELLPALLPYMGARRSKVIYQMLSHLS
jgi:hypothetical protein